MPATHLGSSADMREWAVWLSCVMAAASLAVLLAEMRRSERGAFATVGTGLFAVGALLLAVLRPARVSARESKIGARVVVLADTSRSMALVGDDRRPRRDARDDAISLLRKIATGARLLVLGFGDGAPTPLGEEDLLSKGATQA